MDETDTKSLLLSRHNGNAQRLQDERDRVAQALQVLKLMPLEILSEERKIAIQEAIRKEEGTPELEKEIEAALVRWRELVLNPKPKHFLAQRFIWWLKSG